MLPSMYLCIKLPDCIWKCFQFAVKHATRSETICLWKQVYSYLIFHMTRTNHSYFSPFNLPSSIVSWLISSFSLHSHTFRFINSIFKSMYYMATQPSTSLPFTSSLVYKSGTWSPTPQNNRQPEHFL